MGLRLPMPEDMSSGRLVNDYDALPPGVADDTVKAFIRPGPNVELVKTGRTFRYRS
jgi:hypothetical protein